MKWHGMEYRGTLVSVDSYMNLQLAGTREIIDGVMQEGTLGDFVIRCNNVLYVRDMRGFPLDHNCRQQEDGALEPEGGEDEKARESDKDGQDEEGMDETQ